MPSSTAAFRAAVSLGVCLLGGICHVAVFEPLAAAATPVAVEQASPGLRFERTPRWTGYKAPYWVHTSAADYLVSATGFEIVPPALDGGAGPEGRIAVELVGAREGARVEAAGRLAGTRSFAFGSDPAAWEDGVPGFSGVRVAGVYPGIDMVYSSKGGRLEYGFEIARGADPGKIRLRVKGGAATVDGERLRIVTDRGESVHEEVAAYQGEGAARRTVGVGIVARKGGEIGFDLGEYDKALPLVIDPVTAFVDYFGGGLSDGGLAIATSDDGYTYVAGTQTFGGGSSNAFVRKIDRRGLLVWEKLFGGTGAEIARGVSVSALGHVFVAGMTTSNNFPGTNGAFAKTCPKKVGQVNCANKMGFVGRLDPVNGNFVYLSHLTGTYSDEAWAVVADENDNAFVVGDARSGDINAPVAIAPHVTPGSPNPTDDAFLAAVNPLGTALLYVAYVGGTGVDQGRAVAYTPKKTKGGRLAVGGTTGSMDLPTTAMSYQKTLAGGTDAFLMVTFDPTTLYPLNQPVQRVQYSYVGGVDNELGNGVGLDDCGCAYLVGQTFSMDFPGTSFGGTLGFGEGFVSKLQPTLTKLDYAHLIGGNGLDSVNAIAVAEDHHAFLTGHTESSNFPVTADCLQCATPGGGGGDAFLMELGKKGDLVSGSYLGGGMANAGLMPADSGNGIAVDSSSKAVVAGTTSSNDLAQQLGGAGVLPVTPYQGSSDAFVVGLAPCGAPKVNPMKELENHTLVQAYLGAPAPEVRTRFAGSPNWGMQMSLDVGTGLTVFDVKLGFNLDGQKCPIDDIACQNIGYRYMAKSMSLPYFDFSLTASNGVTRSDRCTLDQDTISGATANDWFCRSRLVDFDIQQDEQKFSATATYEVMTEPPPPPGKPPSSCLIVRHSQELWSRVGSNRCELTSRALCNRFRPLVRYHYYHATPPGAPEPTLEIKVPQRLELDPDDVGSGREAMFGDNHGPAPGVIGPVLYKLLDNPLPVEARARVITAGKPEPVPGMMFYQSVENPMGYLVDGYIVSTQTIDNVHQSAKEGPIDEPKMDGAAIFGAPFTLATCNNWIAMGYAPEDCLPHFIIPGCPDCVHIHWRWAQVPASTLYALFPQFAYGDEILPRGSKQDVNIAYTTETNPTPNDYTAYAADATDIAMDSGKYVLFGNPPGPKQCPGPAQCDSLAPYGTQPIFWYEAISTEHADTLFYHGGWFHATSEVGGTYYKSPPPPAMNPLD